MKITHQESRIFHSSCTAYGLQNPPDIQRSFIHVHPSSLSSLAASKYIPRLDPTEVVDPWLIRMGKHSTDKIWVHKLGNFWWPMRPRAKHTRPKRRHITYTKYKNNHAFLPTASGCFWNNHIDHTYIGQISWMLLALQFQCAGWLLKLNDTIWGWYCSGYKSGETKTNGAVVFHVHLIFSFSICGIPGISVSLSSFQGEE